MQIAPDQIIVYPVPLRPDVVVRLHMPANLTKEEAEKIANVIKAFARPLEKGVVKITPCKAQS